MHVPIDKPWNIISGFGPRNINVPGASKNHEGVDFKANTGTPVYAVKSGDVVLTTDNGAPGISVLYQIDSETRIRCNHFSRRTVGRGNRVSEGQVIGYVGSTGVSDVPHLHFAVYKLRNGRWTAIEPLAWLGQAGGSGSGRVTVPRSVKSIQRLVGASQDGIYGPDTTAKVKAWQKRNGLTSDGIWGPASDAKGFPPKPVQVSHTLKRGSRGAAVVALQQRLKRDYPLYASKLAVDGIFGPATEAVVREFQRRAGLVVDGLVGPATRQRLGL